VSATIRDQDPAPHGDGPCAVGAIGVVRATLEELPALRKAPGPLPNGRRIPPSLLKHADEQTVVALAAVLRAIHEAQWQDRRFDEWGLIAAPRFLGRLALAPSLRKFERLGAASVSPLIIPTLSLHAVSGSISLALGIRGFNFGAGGGPGHLAEALLAGLAARDDGAVPGLWLVATGWDPEPIPGPDGKSLTPCVATAVALALVPGEAARWGLRRIPAAPPRPSDGLTGPEEEEIEPSLAGLAGFLSEPAAGGRGRTWYGPLPGGGAIALADDPAAAAGRRASRLGA
jgi:hypothetical protein